MSDERPVSEERRELEQLLVRDPFDGAARGRYAELLFTEGDYTASLGQWRLVARQNPTAAEPHLRAAQCCQRLDDAAGVAEHVAQARGCGDFSAEDPRLAELEEAPQQRQRLRVVAGGRRDPEPLSADVISIGATDVVRFSDVVGMEALKQVIRLRIIEPFLRPGLFQRFKKRSGGGVLLYGPPGCGKTLIARALASECQASFTAVGISDILNLWIGESERNLAAIFDKARADAPAVVFFDELDALAFARCKARSEHTRTLVNEFLNQLDGMAGRNDRVLVVAATNMPWDVDEAMKRPGRFDRQIFVPPPDAAARAEMFRMKLRDVPVEAVDAEALALRCRNFSGADIDGVIDQAKDLVLGEILTTGEERRLTQADLTAGIEATHPSTLDWLKTARNLVKFGGASSAYKDVEAYLRAEKLY